MWHRQRYEGDENAATRYRGSSDTASQPQVTKNWNGDGDKAAPGLNGKNVNIIHTLIAQNIIII